jgi:hypothetical protein
MKPQTALLYRISVVVVVSLGLLVAGCAGSGPKLFPTVPLKVEQSAAGGTLQWYDTNGDGESDYAEQIGADGRIEKLHYSLPDGSDREVDLRAVPASQQRDLVLILDSVPYPLVRDAWDHGLFRFFPRPTRTIPPFPVMTDPSLIDFFHLSPGIAIESDYYDGHKELSPYGLYLDAKLSIWHRKVDYRLPHSAHAWAYLDQLPWFDHELRRIQDGFERSNAGETPVPQDKKTYIGYCMGTSALGALQGWEGHAKGLSHVDRFCHEMVYRTQGRVRITLLSDHGHNDTRASRRIPLSDLLRSFGYHVSDTLKSPGDLVVPEFAVASCAAIYTRSPALAARDVLKIEGIEISAYPDSDGSLIVLGHDSRARITRSADAYKYEPITGDPLLLVPILGKLKQQGRVLPDGFVPDAVLLAATADHVYADAIDRLWRAFHDEFQHKPDVLLATCDGYYCGSAFASVAVGTLRSIHGNLRPLSSSGFAVSSAGELPPVLRIRDLSTALHKLGVDVLR